MIKDAYLCSYVRTPIGRYAGALSSIRSDDLAALPISELMQRHPNIDWSVLDEVILGCANQAGEDNRNVARMASLLAGLPESIPATTINRLCGSGMDAIIIAARAIKAGEADLIIAGGVAANKALRAAIKDLEASLGIRVFYPSLKYCGDNAAMIAFVGSLRSSDKIEHKASYVRARWPLSELT